MTLPDVSLPLLVPLTLVALALGLTLLTGHRVRALDPLPEPDPEAPLPSVCLCIPARDEAAELGPALDSWLAQDHPRLHIVVVDDGSVDATPQLLAERAMRHPGRLTVLRNDRLPPGWLGKNHALHLATATEPARGADWLLFVDADVHATPPDLLRRAFAQLARRPADALALVPAVDTVGFWERLLLPAGATAFLWLVPPGWVADPRRFAHCGVGAFTLLRREVYDRIGGHGAAPMDPVDDMGLARRAKRSGALNRVAVGGPGLHLRMYPGLGAFVRAMRKNALGWPFTALLALPAVALILAFFLSPLWLAALGHAWAGILIWLLAPVAIGTAHQRLSRRPMDLAWALWPLAALPLAAGILWALGDRLRGVNHWRGRSVSLRRP